MTKEELFQKSKVFLFDLDGTLYLNETVIAGAPQALDFLRAAGKGVGFVTNNSSKSTEEYLQKLIRLGLYRKGDLMLSSGTAALDYLRQNCQGKRVYLMANEGLKREYRDAGVELVEEAPQVVVLANAFSLDFEELKKFNKFLYDGAFYIATHPDDRCPSDDVPFPDVGAFISLFRHSSRREPDVIAGKPFPILADVAARHFGVPCAQICMVGDRLSTDIRFGNRNGMMTLLVETGVTTREGLAASEDKPTLVLPSVADLMI